MSYVCTQIKYRILLKAKSFCRPRVFDACSGAAEQEVHAALRGDRCHRGLLRALRRQGHTAARLVAPVHPRLRSTIQGTNMATCLYEYKRYLYFTKPSTLGSAWDFGSRGVVSNHIPPRMSSTPMMCTSLQSMYSCRRCQKRLVPTGSALTSTVLCPRRRSRGRPRRL